MKPTFAAALWMLGAIFSFTTMAISGRELSDHFDTFEIMLYRSAIGLIIVTVIIYATGLQTKIGLGAWRTHLLRNIFHFTGQNLWLYALAVIPLAQVFALEFTSPLWVILLSSVLLSERITWVRSIAALLGFIGILIVARPSMDTVHSGVVAAAACAFFFALTYIYTKRLTQTEHIAAIMLYLCVFQFMFGLMCAAYDGDIFLPVIQDIPLLTLLACCGLLAHFCITKALTIAPATFVAPLDFVRLPIVAVAAMLIYNESLDIWVFVGAMIIFAGNYLNIWYETRKRT